MSKLHFGGHALRIARIRLLRDYQQAGITPQCWRCGRVIDHTLSGLHPDGATVGHILPVSRGGDDSYDNLALEHRRCNLSASNRIAPPRAAIASPFFSSGNGADLPLPSRRTVGILADLVSKPVDPSR